MDARAILQELVECILAHQPAPLTDRKAAQRELKAYEAARAYLAQPVAVPHELVARDDWTTVGEAEDIITALAADAESWRQQSEDRVDDCLQFAKERDNALADNERLRVALRWYADPIAYSMPVRDMKHHVFPDMGKVARAALGEP